MNDSDNFDLGASQQPASTQPAAGWYFAQGDPPGTERYWNGSSWEGTYRAVGGFSPSSAMPRPADGFPSGIKVLAWVITVLKTIPLIFGALGLALLSSDSIRADLETEADISIDEFSTTIYVVGGVIIVIGLILLIGQIRAVMKRNVGQALIWAGVMTVVDVLYVLINIPSGDPVSLGLAVVVLGAQAALFGWLWKLREPAAATGF